MSEAATPPMYYSGSTLDRAAAQRAGLTWSTRAAGDPATRLLPLWLDHTMEIGRAHV